MAVIELVREPVSAKPKRAVVAEAEGATKRAAKDKKASVPLTVVRAPVFKLSSPVPPVTFCALAPSVKVLLPLAST